MSMKVIRAARLRRISKYRFPLFVNLARAFRVRGSLAPKPSGELLPRQARASEHDRPDVKQAREQWTSARQPVMRLEPHRLVFLDETGTTTKMTRLRGRSPKGRRLLSKAPFGHWKTQTFIAGLRCDALTAPFVIDAPMDRRIFETYVETQLAPTLKPGDVVVLDNLPAHKSAAAEQAIRAKGAWLVPSAL